MAITRQMARLILAEHKFRNISGQALLLGRQTVFMTPDEALKLVESAGVAIRPDAKIAYDKTTAGGDFRRFISDASFFSLFSDAHVIASDVSDYEGAELVFDLSSADIPASTLEGFDFIYNGSVLDNVFDPAACIRNISRMLKPNGVVFHYEGVRHSGRTYLKFMPEWFFDYYAVNRFRDCQAYILAYHDYFGVYSVLEWTAFYEKGGERLVAPATKLPGEAMVVVIAEKSAESEVSTTPIESTYRSDNGPYISASLRFARNSRRGAVREQLASYKVNSAELKPYVDHAGAAVGDVVPNPMLNRLLQWAGSRLGGVSMPFRTVRTARSDGPAVPVRAAPFEPTLAHEFIGEV